MGLKEITFQEYMINATRFPTTIEKVENGEVSLGLTGTTPITIFSKRFGYVWGTATPDNPDFALLEHRLVYFSREHNDGELHYIMADGASGSKPPQSMSRDLEVDLSFKLAPRPLRVPAVEPIDFSLWQGSAIQTNTFVRWGENGRFPETVAFPAKNSQ